jgi:miniconductance mechanosensitive channel
MHLLNDPAIWIKDMFLDAGFDYGLASFLSTLALVFLVSVLSWLSLIITRVIVLRVVTRIVKKTSSKWDDIFLEQKVFSQLSHLAPAFVIWFIAGWALKTYPWWLIFVHKLTYIYIVIIGTVVLNSFIEAWHKIYNTLPISQHRHIKGYVQLVKIFVVIIGLLIIVSILFKRDISSIVAGLGAMAAVLILVFRDTLLGLVASIQLSADKMLKVGDWITIPGRQVDGNVTDITLNTVKIQNFDKTIITVPTYALVNESFQNWRGMEDSRVRQIKSAITIDMRSIKFLNSELKEKLSRVPLLKEYMESVEDQNGKKVIPSSDTFFFSYSQITNLGVFRYYAEAWLRNHKYVDETQPVILRHREPVGNGLPLQVYLFTKNNQFSPYENIQSEVFEHLLAIMNEFELKVFQQPTGDDLLMLTRNELYKPLINN